MMQSLGGLAISPAADAATTSMTASTAVNVRSAPSATASRLGVLYRGAQIEAVSEKSGWTEVRYNGKTGYVSSSYLTGPKPGATSPAPSAPTASPGSAVTTGNLNLRSGPATTNRILFVAPKGTTVGVTGRAQNGFTEVTYKSTTAWAASRYLTSAAPAAPAPTPPPAPTGPAAGTGSAKTTGNLNLRGGAGLTHPVVFVAPSGTTVATTGRTQNGFTEVVYKSRTVWGSSKYLTIVSAPAPKPTPAPTPAPTPPASVPTAGSARTTANLNIRSGPATSHPIIHIASKGTTVSLTGRTHNGFSEVIYNSKTLWASTRYLTTVQAAPAPSLPTTTKKMRATTALMIRTTNTSSYRSLGDIPRGTIVDATDKVVNGVREIVWQGNVRWVNNRYLVEVTPEVAQPVAPTPPTTTIQYATATLNIWHASTGSSYTGEIPKGATVEVTGKVADGRAEIVHNGALRWVTARYLQKAEVTQPVTVATKYATTDLNLWHASTGSAYTGVIAKGSAVQLTGEERDGRAEAVFNGTPRWVTARYLTTTAPSTPPIDSGAVNYGYSSGLDKANSDIRTIAAHVWATFPQITTQHGWRNSPASDHYAGRSLDIMIPSYRTNQAYGWEIANYFRTNAKKFNINYIIFEQKIWNITRDSEGWRAMADRGSDSANHLDHVHITTFEGTTSGGSAPVASVSQRCYLQLTSGGTILTLSPEQAQNAAIIVAKSYEMGLPEQAAVIALTTAWQESALRNLAYGDRDSLGLFQQRPSYGWGTNAQIMDPWYSSGRFYQALVKISGWQTGGISEMAQKVQRSAYPSAYVKHETNAKALAGALRGSRPATLVCTGGTGAGNTGAFSAVVSKVPGVSMATSGKTVTLSSANSSALWAATQLAVANTPAGGITSASLGDRTWTGGSATKWVSSTSRTPAGQAVIQLR